MNCKICGKAYEKTPTPQSVWLYRKTCRCKRHQAKDKVHDIRDAWRNEVAR